MKIGFISDIHSRKQTLEAITKELLNHQIDLLVLGGDLTDFGSLEEFQEIAQRAHDLIGVLVLLIPGNCDDPKALEWNGKDGIVNIHETIYKYENYNFLGFGGSNFTPFDTPIEFAEEEIHEKLNRFKGTDNLILVSHVPPYRTKLDRIYIGRHVGSRAIREFIEENSPILVLTGHIHEASGIDKIGETVITNPGPAERGYYSIVEINNGEVNVEIKRVNHS